MPKTKHPSSLVLDRFIAEATKAIRRQGLEYNLVVWASPLINFEAIQFDTGAGYGYAARIFKMEQRDEMVIGFDRFCTKKQGVKTEDAVSVAYWDGTRWHFGIMEYDCSSKTVYPINWKNKHWADVVRDELEGVRIIKPSGECRESENRKHKWQEMDSSGSEYCVHCLKAKELK